MNPTEFVRNIVKDLAAVWSKDVNFAELITEEDMEHDLFYRG